jgi:two-component system, NtrC family, response regulator AtoC
MKQNDAKTTARAFTAWVRSTGPHQVLEGLLEITADDAVFAVDAERNIVYWSPGAERLLGFPATEVLGGNCLKSNRCPECIRGCGISDMGSVRDVLIQMYRRDGTLVAVRKSGRAFFDEQGNFAGGIEILRPEGQPSGQKRPDLFPVLDNTDPEASQDCHGLLSRDPRMAEVFQTLRNVAASDVTVLIRGESGTGKELVARAIHLESDRKDKPFVAVNCAAISPALLESELFGHEKGAFTGAVKEHQGVFERADGGTLFLDEVAELPLALQAKLLRVLQEQTFFRVGGSQPVTVDVRILSATHRSLREEVAAGRFREDLLYRLRVVPLFLPPLRERRTDVPLLLRHFIGILNERGRRQVTAVAPEAMRVLLDHAWKGNVRELQNVLEYAFAVGRGAELRLTDLPPEFKNQLPGSPPIRESSPPGHGASPTRATSSDEATRMREALTAHAGNVGQAAESLGMSRPTFWRKRKKYGID